eukprot:gene17108-6138_t
MSCVFLANGLRPGHASSAALQAARQNWGKDGEVGGDHAASAPAPGDGGLGADANKGTESGSGSTTVCILPASASTAVQSSVVATRPRGRAPRGLKWDAVQGVPGDVEVNRPTTDGAGAERGSGVGGGSGVADVLRTPTPSRPLRPERDVEVGDTVSPLRPARASVPPGVLVANGSLSDTRALVGAAGSTTAKKDKKKKGASTKGMVASVGMNINAKITLEDEVHDEVEVEVKVKSSGGGRSRVRSLAKSTNSQSGSRKRRRHAAPIATMVADSEDEDEEDEEKDDIDEQKEDEVVEEEVLAIPTSVAVSPPPPGSEDAGVQTGEKNAKKKKKKKKKMNKSRAHMPKAKLWCRGQPLDCGHIVYAQDLQEIWLAARIIELALPDDVNGYK